MIRLAHTAQWIKTEARWLDPQAQCLPADLEMGMAMASRPCVAEGEARCLTGSWEMAARSMAAAGPLPLAERCGAAGADVGRWLLYLWVRRRAAPLTASNGVLKTAIRGGRQQCEATYPGMHADLHAACSLHHACGET